MAGITQAAVVAGIYGEYGGEADLVFVHSDRRRVLVRDLEGGDVAEFSIAQLLAALRRASGLGESPAEVTVPIYSEVRKRLGSFGRTDDEKQPIRYVHPCGQEYLLSADGMKNLIALLEGWAA